MIEQRNEYTARAIKFSHRLKDLIDELFEMAKLDTLDSAPHTEAFALPELVQDVLQQFDANAQKQGIHLLMEGDRHLAFVQADIALIQRVLENLVGNALRHVQAGDSVTVHLSANEDTIEIAVSDTGCGIEEDALAYIFDPLYQVDNKHRSGEHSGLGLAIVKRILQLHGSEISVSSKLDQGTIFTFKLRTSKG
ncbi:MAG: ATP-binding protein [Ghiorsea sp.]|nr:ATP-binding protein [Ghiorsea sp.]